MTVERAIYLRLKDNLKKFKSPKYLRWWHEKHHGKSAHHAFGSHTSSKTSDYLLLPLSHEKHMELHNKGGKAECTIDQLHQIINDLQEYTHHLENEK